MKKVKEKIYSVVTIMLWIIFVISVTYILVYYLLETFDNIKNDEIRNLKENISYENNINNKQVVLEIEKENENVIENIINKENNLDVNNIELLKKEYKDLIGWIKVPGTNIDYPIMQAEDNDYYLKRSYDGKSSMNGSIFLDYRVDFNSNAFNAIIYGHNNQNNKMFENLIKYTSEDFYKENSKIIITTDKGKEEYEIFSVFKSEQFEKNEKEVFKYYNVIDLSQETLFNDYIKNVTNIALYKTDIIPKYGEKIITLSTCEYTNENGRLVVVARKK